MNQFLMHKLGWVLATLGLFSCQSKAPQKPMPVVAETETVLVDSSRTTNKDSTLIDSSLIAPTPIPKKAASSWNHRTQTAYIYLDTNTITKVRLYPDVYAMSGHKSKLANLNEINEYASKMWKMSENKSFFPMHLGNGYLELYYLSAAQKSNLGDSLGCYGNYIHGEGINAVLLNDIELYIDPNIPLADFMGEIPFEANYSNPKRGCYYIRLKTFDGALISKYSQQLRKRKGLITIRNQIYTAEPVPFDSHL